MPIQGVDLEMIKWRKGIRSPRHGDGVRYGNTDSYEFDSRFNHNAIVVFNLKTQPKTLLWNGC